MIADLRDDIVPARLERREGQLEIRRSPSTERNGLRADHRAVDAQIEFYIGTIFIRKAHQQGVRLRIHLRIQLQLGHRQIGSYQITHFDQLQLRPPAGSDWHSSFAHCSFENR